MSSTPSGLPAGCAAAPSPEVRFRELRHPSASALQRLQRTLLDADGDAWPPLVAVPGLARSDAESVHRHLADACADIGDSARVVIGLEPQDSFEAVGFDIDIWDATLNRLVALLDALARETGRLVVVTPSVWQIEEQRVPAFDDDWEDDTLDQEDDSDAQVAEDEDDEGPRRVVLGLLVEIRAPERRKRKPASMYR